MEPYSFCLVLPQQVELMEVLLDADKAGLEGQVTLPVPELTEETEGFLVEEAEVEEAVLEEEEQVGQVVRD